MLQSFLLNRVHKKEKNTKIQSREKAVIFVNVNITTQRPLNGLKEN